MESVTSEGFILWRSSQSEQIFVERCFSGAGWTDHQSEDFSFTKVAFLPAGASNSRERGFRDSKALNDKTGSLHLGKIQTFTDQFRISPPVVSQIFDPLLLLCVSQCWVGYLFGTFMVPSGHLVKYHVSMLEWGATLNKKINQIISMDKLPPPPRVHFILCLRGWLKEVLKDSVS